jgi:heme/copper-type cytochrome/quinol oxidase subunit 4
MNLTIRLIVISAIIVAVTDVVEYIHLKQHPEQLTVRFLILVILVTIVPMAINIWFHTGEQLNLTTRLIAIQQSL